MELLDKDNDVLDFGCGNGIFLPTLSKTSKTVVGYDPSSNLINIKKMLNKYAVKNVTLTDSFPKGKYDVIICADVLEHIKNLEPIIKKLSNLLKKDGKLIISAPTENRLYRLCRKIGGLNEPKDHYHNAKGIVHLIKKYLKQNKKMNLPFFGLPDFLNLFIIIKFTKE